jgi:hypothetical protein
MLINARHTIIALALTLGTAMAPAAHATARKAPPVTVPAQVFATPTSKLCMASSVLGRDAAKTLPKTMCQTKAEWEAQGVVFVIT